MPAVPESQSETGESSTASPYTLTLNQVYCDGLYLRIGLTLTAPDGNDSLAVTTGWPRIRAAKAGSRSARRRPTAPC